MNNVTSSNSIELNCLLVAIESRIDISTSDNLIIDIRNSKFYSM